MNVIAQRALAFGLGILIGVGTLAGGILALMYPQVRLQMLESRIDQHRQVILEDLANDAPEPWAGSYVSGGFEAHVLDISPAGFYFKYGHCTGTSHLALGSVSVDDGGRLCLDVETEVVDLGWWKSKLGSGNKLLSIPWGEERFIVPVEFMSTFCASVKPENGLRSREYTSFMRLHRPGQNPWAMPELEGFPQVPKEFAHLLGE